jgi:hypothetical protein
MLDSQTNLIGGVNLDKDPRTLSTSELSYAKDNENIGIVEGEDLSTKPLPSSSEIFEVPNLQVQYQYVRAKFEDSVDSYTFTIKDLSGNSIGPSSITIAISPSDTVSDLITALNAILGGYGYTATTDDTQGAWFSLAIYQGSGTPIGFTLTQSQTISGTTTDIIVYTLQDAFNPIGSINAQFKPLSSIYVGNIGFILSKSYDGTATTFGYAVANQSGVYTYTELFTTSKIIIPENQVIELQAEKNNSRYNFYWVDNTSKPKCMYVPETLGQYAPLRYNMTDFEDETLGIFTLESIGVQTDLQIQNPSRVNFNSQLDNGGNLEAGTWFYFTSLGINNDYSEWSGASEGVAVFTEGITSPSAGFNVGGDLTPATTGKCNVLTITGAKPQVYNRLRLAAVLNQGGAFSGVLIGEYDIPSDSFEITHTGTETGSSDYDFRLLPPVQEVFLRAKNNQIKKNRYNLANIEVANDENLEAIFSNVTLGQTTETMDNTGSVTLTENPLFRVSIPSQYTESNDGEISLNLSVNTSNGDFNSGGAYFISPDNWFVPPSNGDYYITIQLSGLLPSGSGGISEIYAVDLVTGEKLVTINPTSTLVQTRFNLFTTRLVTLNTAQKIAMKFFVRLGSSAIDIYSASFIGTKVISDYNYKFLTVGEYQQPSNIALKRGYMVNEKYAFFARVYYKTGYITNWYYLGQYQFGNGSFPANLQDGFLQDNSFNTLTYALTISGLDISSIKDDIYRIEFGRAVCNPTILGTGIFIPSHGIQGGNEGGTFKSGLYTGNTTGGAYGQNINNSNSVRYFGVMISPDWLISGEPQFKEGDYLINYGQYEVNLSSFLQAGANTKWGSGVDLKGNFIPFTALSPASINIADAAPTAFNTNSRILENDAQSLFLGASLDQTGTIDTLSTKCVAMSLESKIIPNAGTASGSDLGIYYVQYVRPISNQYDIENLTIVSCNAYVEVSASTSDVLPIQTIFGGDTYTQKTYVKVLYNAFNPDTASGGTLSSMVGFYSQNKINAQMRYVDKTFNNKPFPFGTPLGDYLFGTYEAQEQFNIDNGYTWYLPLTNGKPYNNKIVKERVFESRIYYSQQKALGNVADPYRTILPNDYKDLPAKDGGIVALLDTNDVMLAIQPTSVSTLQYQADVALSSADGSIYIGNGGVYAQRENVVSKFGASIKSGTILAENRNGNAQAYWYSDTARAFLRYGQDGVRNLSEENGFRTWFINSSKLVKDEFDIVIGFDRNRKAIFITARSLNDTISEWNSATSYVVGNYVRYGTINKYNNFEWMQDIYVALGSSTNSNPYDNPSNWELVPETNMFYYNKWTAVWNEARNYFQGFFTLMPERYFNLNGIMLVPRGRPSYGKVFDVFGGTGYLQWLSQSGVYKQGTFTLEVVGNMSGRGLVPERYQGVGLQVGMSHDVANNPSGVIYTELQNEDNVSNGESVLSPTDFEYQNGQIGSGIYPNTQDEVIIGDWAKFRFTTQNYIRVFSIVIIMYVKRRILSK